jgi:hypothetical protein
MAVLDTARLPNDAPSNRGFSRRPEVQPPPRQRIAGAAQESAQRDLALGALGVIRLVIVLAELDPAVAGQSKPNTGDQHEADGQHDEPGATSELYTDEIRRKGREAGCVDDSPHGDCTGNRKSDNQ